MRIWKIIHNFRMSNQQMKLLHIVDTIFIQNKIYKKHTVTI